MGTERRASLVGIASSPSSSSGSNSAAVPRDFQPAPLQSAAASTPGGPSSPLRKRRRSYLMQDGPSGGRPSLPPMTLPPSERQDEASYGSGAGSSRGEPAKRQKSASPPPGSYERDHERGMDSSSRPRPGPPAWQSWSDRPAPPGRYGGLPTNEHDALGRADGRSRPGEMEPPHPRSEHEANWKDSSRGMAGLVGGRYPDGDRLPPGFRDSERPQSELPDAMRGPHRLPFPGPPPPSASVPADKLGASLARRHPSSPPPRLPSFASLDSEGMAARPRDDGHPPLGPGPGSFPGSGHPSPRRILPYRPPGHYPPYLPGPQSRTPILSHASPSASSSYGNPPMIHPSLAGLPGAGGGQGGKQQPSFVSKLYSMLEDPSIEDMISWGPSGTVFSVANPAEFSRLVLPNWFKHSNWQSFVRQLNMYGFHKVNHSYQGNPTDEIQVWEFRHPSFRRGEIGLLNDIKRKSSRQKRTGSPSRSLAGTDLRADRSGGSSTPSPEVPLAAIPGSGEMGRMPVGIYRVPGREHAMSDPRMEARAYELATSDPRGLRIDGDGGYMPMGGDPRFRRPKTEMPDVGPGMGPGGGPLGAGNTYSAAGAGFLEERGYPDSQIDRNEVLARFEDLSERSDAIIRHASFLEGQVRTLSEQLNESRAYTQHCVREELTIVLERLAHTLSAPPSNGADPVQTMLSAIKAHLAALQPQPHLRDREPMPPAASSRPHAAAAAPMSPSSQSHGYPPKRSSV
ncbi:uncharacterized protein PSFLO_03364 [Pseudozyma flocculosa]|nr:uncharacterized protein PSFLO_03364 [Pseudozyma flocculosa]